MSASVASAGLVSVLTTPTGVAAFEVRRVAQAAAGTEVIRKGGVPRLVTVAGALVIDKAANRLARLRRSVGFAARAHAVSERGHRSDVPWMVTLTYRGDNRDWKSDHMTRAMDRVRLWCKRETGGPLRYVWVAELQQRGVIHYHICIWLPRGVRMPKWDTRGWWDHGATNRKVARNAVPYLMKYLSKGSESTFGRFPHGARIFGVGGLDHALGRARRWLGLPAFVQGNSSIHDRWTRAVGGGWTSPGGQHFESEFRRVLVCGRDAVQRVCSHPVAIQASGPFSWLSDRERAFAARLH